MTNSSAAIKPVWITLRSADPEFVAFLGASSSTDAIDRAIARCTDAHGLFQESALAGLKREFLRFAGDAMGLPQNLSV